MPKAQQTGLTARQVQSFIDDGHRGTRPRFMAQPPLLPKGEFDPALPPSPVQIAIRRACGMMP